MWLWKEGMEMGESRLFQMPVEIAVILTQIPVFMSIASERGFESVPRPEIWGREVGEAVDWEML